jgi:hypothetical protein
MKLSEIRKTKEVEVGGIKVKLQDLSWPDFMSSMEIEDLLERGAFRLVKAIVSWDLQDDDGKELPVNEENIKQLPAKIIMPLIDATREVFAAEKKKN